MDGARDKVEKGLKFYGGHPDTAVLGTLYLHRWITRENVNEIVERAGFSGSIDLLSLDLDGNDYWIWEALTVVNPRVVVIEFMPQLGTESVAVPYREDFEAEWIPMYPCDLETGESLETELPDDLSYFRRWTVYAGASLAALNKLARKKGYTLIGANSVGYNAFFIRNDLVGEPFKEVEEADCFNHNMQDRMSAAGEVLKQRDWVKV